MSRDSYSRHFYGTLVRQEQLVSPPPRLIPQVINKLKRKTCTGTLVVPEWTSAPCWPMIVDGQSNFRSYIVAHRFFHGENLTKRGRGQSGVYGDRYLKFRLLALRIAFRSQDAYDILLS